MRFLILPLLFVLISCERISSVESNPTSATITMVAGKEAPNHLRRIPIGETPMAHWRTPSAFKSIWEFEDFVEKHEVYLEIKHPGFEVETVALKEFLKIYAKDKKIFVNLKPLVALNELEQMKNRAEFESSLHKTVTFNSNVSNALVYVNGVLMGNTPLTLKQLPGSYLIELKHAQCAQSSQELVNMKEQKNAASFNIALKNCRRVIAGN